MTTAAQTPRILYSGTSGSGTLGPFAIQTDGTDWDFTDNSHIQVTRFGTATTALSGGTLLVEGTDYDIASNEVTMTSPQTGLLDTERLLIERIEPRTQTLDLTSAAAVKSETLEARLDAVARQIQDLYVRADRNLKQHWTESVAVELPPVASRASKLLGFDASGVPIAASVDGSDGSAAQPVDATLTALAGLSTSDGDLVEATGSDTFRLIRRTVDTLSDLQALAGQQNNDIIFMLGRASVGDGGEGIFRFVQGDQSSSVTADTQSGVWVAPDSDDTGASGAWKRILNDAALTPEMFGASTASTDNDTALEAMFAQAVALGVPCRSVKGNRYDVSTLAIPNSAILEGDWEFEANGDIDTGGVTDNDSHIITLGTDVIVTGELYVYIPAAVELDRVIQIDARSRGHRIFVESEDQNPATFSDNLDGAIRFVNGGHRWDYVKTKKLDKGVVIYQADGSHFGYIETEEYITGVYLRDTDGLVISEVYGHEPSANLNWRSLGGSVTAQSPGQNALLVAGVKDLEIGLIRAFDAAEHGVRIGGWSGGEQANENIGIGRVIARRNGQCGFKIKPSIGDTINFVSIEEIEAYDCAYSNTPGSNEDGARFESVTELRVGRISVQEDEGTTAAYDGIFMKNCNYVQIGQIYVLNTTRHGLAIDHGATSLDGSYASGDEPITINFINIEGGLIALCGGDGFICNIDYSGVVVRDFHVQAIIRGCTGTGWLTSATVDFRQQNIWQGYAYSNGTNKSITGDADLEDAVTAL